jgi:hypothetical protein
LFFAGEFVASGSDDGRWFIWQKKTGRLIKILAGDENGIIACFCIWALYASFFASVYCRLLFWLMCMFFGFME